MKAIFTTDLLDYRKEHQTKLSADEWYGIIKTGSVPLDMIKQAKLDQLKECCELAILAGFRSEQNGHLYSFGQYDQLNFTQQMLVTLGDPSIDGMSWKTEDAGLVQHSRNQFLALCKEAEQHKRSKMSKDWMLKEQVHAAQSAEQLDKIVW